MSQPLFRLTGYRDDFGAVYIGGRGLPEDSVLEWTQAGLEKIFPRMILDPARGLRNADVARTARMKTPRPAWMR